MISRSVFDLTTLVWIALPTWHSFHILLPLISDTPNDMPFIWRCLLLLDTVWSHCQRPACRVELDGLRIDCGRWLTNNLAFSSVQQFGCGSVHSKQKQVVWTCVPVNCVVLVPVGSFSYWTSKPEFSCVLLESGIQKRKRRTEIQLMLPPTGRKNRKMLPPTVKSMLLPTRLVDSAPMQVPDTSPIEHQSQSPNTHEIEWFWISHNLRGCNSW